MEEPPGTPPIKAEPEDEAKVTQPLGEHEIISLISDDEEAAPGRSLFTSLREHSRPPETLNIGTSMFSKKAKPASAKSAQPAKKGISLRLQEMLKKARLDSADRLRQHPGQSKPLGRPQAARSPDTPGMFVTDSRPGTPDAAEVFRALQKDVEAKRMNGTLTWEEDIAFVRAESDEKARILKQQLDVDYDASRNSAEYEQDPRLSPDVASLPDEVQPKKQGRKRKAGSPPAGQPKKRRAPRKSTEEILDIARRKREEKAKGKAKGKTGKQAAKKQGGRKKRPNDPNLLSSTNMYSSNVFEDAAQNRDLPAQPGFEVSSRKDAALKSLIASVPEDCRPVAKMDKKYLDDASMLPWRLMSMENLD